MDPDTNTRRTLVDQWEGPPLNSPNDVVMAADGAMKPVARLGEDPLTGAPLDAVYSSTLAVSVS